VAAIPDDYAENASMADGGVLGKLIGVYFGTAPCEGWTYERIMQEPRSDQFLT